MSFITRLVSNQKNLILVMYACLAILILGLYFINVRPYILSFGETVPLILILMLGFVEQEVDRSRNLKIWGMINFFVAIFIGLLVTRTDFLIQDLAFSSYFKFKIGGVPIFMILSWILVNLTVMSLISKLNLRNNLLNLLLGTFTTSILTFISGWFSIRAGFITYTSFQTVYYLFLVIFIFSIVPIFSHLWLKLNRSTELLIHCGLIQTILLIWLAILF